MRRRLFTFASLISLLLCLATVGMWVRSYRMLDYLGWSRIGSRYVAIITLRGSRLNANILNPSPIDLPLTWRNASADGPTDFWITDSGTEKMWAAYRPHLFAGARFQQVETADMVVPPKAVGVLTMAEHTHWIAVDVPFWHLVLLTALSPAIWVLVHVRRTLRRRLHIHYGLCSRCGYNLTGNTSGICPECGAACKAANPAGVSPAAGD